MILKKMIITVMVLVSSQNQLFGSQQRFENVNDELNHQLDSAIASSREVVDAMSQRSQKLDKLLASSTKNLKEVQDLKKSSSELKEVEIMNLFGKSFATGLVTAGVAFVVLSYIEK